MLAAVVLLTAVAANDERTLEARRTEAPPLIDGRLDEAAWKEAAITRSFTQKFPREGDPPSEATELRLLYDDEAIYVAFECRQLRAPIVGRMTRRDDPALSDSVSFNLGTRGDGRSAFEFGVNVAGVLMDGLRFGDTQYSAEWDENWQASTARTSDGWSAEFRIPLRILRFAAARKQSWGFQARRVVASRQEVIEWKLISRLSGGEVSRYGELHGLENLGATSHWELLPFLVGRLERAPRWSATSFESSWQPAGSAGIDLKYHPSQGLTLDATLNPDFAQVEADQALLNLRNVEQYLPEKRAFFLEGTEVFATPLQLLYTRRIGLFPEEPEALGDEVFGAEYAAPVEPSWIVGASKLTGKLGGDWTLGLLQAVTAPNRVVVRSGEARARRLIEPLRAIGVARLRRDLAGGSHVGAMFTASQRLEGGGHAPLPSAEGLPSRGLLGGDKLCPSGVVVRSSSACFNDAYVAGVDWRWSSEDGDWVTLGQLVQSLLQGGPPRWVPDGTIVEPGRVGFGGFAQLVKQSGTLIGELNFEYASDALDYGDLGYAERSNLIGWSSELEYRLPRVWPLIESRLHFEYGAARNTDGLNIGASYYLGTLGKFANLWEYTLYLHYVQRRFDDREIGNGLALERTPAAGVDVTLASDPSRLASFSFGATCEWIEVGANFSGNATVTLNPTAALAVELGPVLSYTLGEPRFAMEGTEPNQFVFGKFAAQSRSMMLRASYAFFPNLTLQLYGQAFLASGDYSGFTYFQGVGRRTSPRLRLAELLPLGTALAENPDFQELALNMNVVLRWEYLSGSTLYAVYTRSQEAERLLGLRERAGVSVADFGGVEPVDRVLVKVGFWWGN